MLRKNMLKYNSYKNVGLFYSKKMMHHVRYESLLEKDFMLILEHDKDVVSYLEQPNTYYYKYNSKRYRYTPDLLINYKNGCKKIIEVKPFIRLEKQFNDARHSFKYEFMKSQLAKENISFDFFTDQCINKIILNNIKFLYQYADFKIPSNLQTALDDAISANHSICKIINKLSEENEMSIVLMAIYYSIFNGVILFDIENYKLPISWEDIIYELV